MRHLRKACYHAVGCVQQTRMILYLGSKWMESTYLSVYIYDVHAAAELAVRVRTTHGSLHGDISTENEGCGDPRTLRTLVASGARASCGQS